MTLCFPLSLPSETVPISDSSAILFRYHTISLQLESLITRFIQLSRFSRPSLISSGVSLLLPSPFLINNSLFDLQPPSSVQRFYLHSTFHHFNLAPNASSPSSLCALNLFLTTSVCLIFTLLLISDFFPPVFVLDLYFQTLLLPFAFVF